MNKPIRYYTIHKNNELYLKIPERLAILNSIWKVKLVKHLTKNKVKLNGLCIPKAKVIKLLDSNTNLKRTLFHEIVHAFLFELNWVQSETTAFSFGLGIEALYDQICPNGGLEITETPMYSYILEGIRSEIKNVVNEELNEIKKTKKRK